LFEAVITGMGMTMFVIPEEAAEQPLELVTITSTTCPLVSVVVVYVALVPD
jgi:hypothetical protein